MVPIDPNDPRELAHVAALREVCYDAFLELRDTLSPNFKPSVQGYKDVDDARFQITKRVDAQMTRMGKEHLKRMG